MLTNSIAYGRVLSQRIINFLINRKNGVKMEKISELGNNLNESVKINVEKNNGIKERFSY